GRLVGCRKAAHFRREIMKADAVAEPFRIFVEKLCDHRQFGRLRRLDDLGHGVQVLARSTWPSCYDAPMGRVILIAFLALVLVAADSPDPVRDLLERGEFEAAAEAGRTVDTAASNAVAAKALLILGAYKLPQDARVAAIHEAEQAARRALDQDPHN